MELIKKYFTDFTAQQWEQFSALYDLYKDWNEKINVVSRKDIDSLYEKHVLHSLSIAAVYDFAKDMTVIDIGTGGGFPGIPLAIFFPEAQFHLVDSIGKKIKVVDVIAQSINLKNVTTQHTRAEEIKNRKFDVAVSRAVAPLRELWNWAKPLLSKKNYHSLLSEEDRNIPSGLICLKGGDLITEIAESGCKPYITDIYEIFPEEYFKEKFILQVLTK
ncbi:MAG: 16S rRNA (guanine(527)-N(7))-methyltransferase RsmG [Bacteroidetes bacterium]|nr:16S rRNA (guanine(527)-N(7))-methyltransferase RsmG [Bacteroidota bacterium]MBS1934567.1 16S rRNA (guanine(527)-N(7))-methyltransferase RsmG [Bacteroidota bacterium]